MQKEEINYASECCLIIYWGDGVKRGDWRERCWSWEAKWKGMKKRPLTDSVCSCHFLYSISHRQLWRPDSACSRLHYQWHMRTWRQAEKQADNHDCKTSFKKCLLMLLHSLTVFFIIIFLFGPFVELNSLKRQSAWQSHDLFSTSRERNICSFDSSCSIMWL